MHVHSPLHTLRPMALLRRASSHLRHFDRNIDHDIDRRRYCDRHCRNAESQCNIGVQLCNTLGKCSLDECYINAIFVVGCRLVVYARLWMLRFLSKSLVLVSHIHFSWKKLLNLFSSSVEKPSEFEEMSERAR